MTDAEKLARYEAALSRIEDPMGEHAQDVQ
jgi:hypothetical protein